jgi:hypothetical protein
MHGRAAAAGRIPHTCYGDERGRACNAAFRRADEHRGAGNAYGRADSYDARTGCPDTLHR